MEQRRWAPDGGRRGKAAAGGLEAEVAVHSRVRKIKRESETVVDWWPAHLETRPHLREMSPSPLGLSGGAVAVGDS